MPAQQSHLKWVEIKDFAPGLWERADWLMPSNAAQQMDNCYPQTGGGLRAWFKPESITTTGITSLSKERVIGLTTRFVSTEPDRYLATQWFDSGASPGSKSKPRLYRMNEELGDTQWTQIFKTSGTTEFDASDNDAPLKTSFRVFTLADGTSTYIIMLNRGTTANAGLYKLDTSQSNSAMKAVKISTTAAGEENPSGALAIHQSRIMVTTGSRIMWSEVAALTFSAENFLIVNPSVAARNIRVMDGTEPSDLLALRQGPGAAIIQGDITDPVIQEMSEGLALGYTTDFGNTPYGKTVILGDGYVYLTDGRSYDNISEQLHAKQPTNDAKTLGDTAYINDFVFMANGYVFDFRTKSWFIQTGLRGQLLNVDRDGGFVWGTVESGGAGFTLAQVHPRNDEDRVATYTWKSAPIRSDDGRQVRVREVMIYAKDYDSNATIAVTVNGTTHTRTMDGSGVKQSLRFLFNEREEVLDVTVTPTAGNASNEAPSIESIRIGLGVGHLT